MALDLEALDAGLSRELAASAGRPIRYRFADVLLPLGDVPETGARLRCCTCGFAAVAPPDPEPCALCGGHAWELQPQRAQMRA